MIFVNAFPKSGTNLVKKALGGLGLTHVPCQLVKMRFGDPIQFSKSPEGTNIAATLALDDSHYVHCHICPPMSIKVGKVINIVREPRNAVISFLRWAERTPDTKGGRHYFDLGGNAESAISLLEAGAYLYGPWVQAMMNFVPWTRTPGVLNVRFEDIATDGGATVARIADFVGYIGESVVKQTTRRAWVYAGLMGNGHDIDGVTVCPDKSTWTGQLSDWRSCVWWTPAVEDCWRAKGGSRLEAALGYR